MASHNVSLLAQAAADAIKATKPRKKRKAANSLESLAETYPDEVEAKAAAKKPRFVPLSEDELKAHADPDGTYVVTPDTLKNKASSLRRFVETIRRDPTGVGSSYLQDGNLISMRLPHGHKQCVQVFSKALPKKKLGEETLDEEILKLVQFMQSAGFNAAYPSFVQSFGYGKHARSSQTLMALAAAQAKTVKIEVKDLEEEVQDGMVDID
jgi:hypothetical protein